MVPAKFIWLDSMPLTPNGKIDKKAFPEPEWNMPDGMSNPLLQTNAEKNIDRDFFSAVTS